MNRAIEVTVQGTVATAPVLTRQEGKKALLPVPRSGLIWANGVWQLGQLRHPMVYRQGLGRPS